MNEGNGRMRRWKFISLVLGVASGALFLLTAYLWPMITSAYRHAQTIAWTNELRQANEHLAEDVAKSNEHLKLVAGWQRRLEMLEAEAADQHFKMAEFGTKQTEILAEQKTISEMLVALLRAQGVPIPKRTPPQKPAPASR